MSRPLSPNRNGQDGSSSDAKESDEDCETKMSRARDELFQQDHQRKCFERVTVGNQEVILLPRPPNGLI